MKLRLSHLLISGIIVLSIFIGTFFWRNSQRNQKPQLNEQQFNAPVSSKYIPTNADLVFHWKINPAILPKYVENYQDKVNKSIVNKKTSFIRDSFFKLISLDFEKDLSKLVGDYGSFAVFGLDKQAENDWLLVLEIKEGINIKEELETILGSKKIDESIGQNNKLSTSKTEVISKRLSSNKTIYFINNKDNLFIASNPKIIDSSIEKLDKNILNTKNKYKNIKLRDNLKDGILLLEISPKEILNLIGEEDNLFQTNEINSLISSINLDKSKINLEGIISYDVKTTMPFKDIKFNFIDIKKEFKSSKDFIIVDNPNHYFRKDSSHPYQKLIASIIKESTTSDYSNLLKNILENSKGNLIWINDKDWFVLTKKSDTSKTKVTDILRKEKFLRSKIDFKNRALEIWSKISPDESEEYELKENIEAIIEEDEESYIWSQNLSSISSFDNTNYLHNYSDNDQKIDKISAFNDILRIHLGEQKTKEVLTNFYPYILFKTMLGNKLAPPQNIDISVAVPAINYPDFIKVKIDLKIS